MTGPSRPELDGVPVGMDAADAELLRDASAILDDRYIPGVHEVATAFRLSGGRIVRGLHVEAGASRASVCAESAALSAAGVAGEDVIAVVSVLQRPGGTRHLIEPCGVCAELLGDHAPRARIWVAVDGAFTTVSAAELLPLRHHRAARRAASAD